MNRVGFAFPKLGMRTIKTAICIFICLLINYIALHEFSLYSSIAAIVCMQSTIENTWKTGLNRLIGTAIGGGLGLLLIPLVETGSIAYVVLVPLFTIIVIYLCNAIRMPGSSVICAIVFIGMFTLPGQGINPYENALVRILETIIGIFVAMIINRCIAPPRYKKPDTYDLAGAFSYIDEKVSYGLSGKETLFLYAKDDIPHGYKRKSKNISPNISIPIPTEFRELKTIHAVYIDKALNISHFNIKPRFGFADIPMRFLPSIILWQSEKNKN